MDQKNHLEDHKEAQHRDSDKSREQSSVIATENKVSKAELLDGDYEIHWDDDDSGEEGLELQDPDGGIDPKVRERKLRARWQPIIQQLRERGRVVIGQDSHLGQLRGGNIVESFKRDIKRMSLDFDVDIDYRGHDHDTVIERLD